MDLNEYRFKVGSGEMVNIVSRGGHGRALMLARLVSAVGLWGPVKLDDIELRVELPRMQCWHDLGDKVEFWGESGPVEVVPANVSLAELEKLVWMVEAMSGGDRMLDMLGLVECKPRKAG